MKVSVIIPIYNKEQGIKETVQSILDQSYQDFEMILVNDGSKDGTEKVIEEYARKYSNKIKCFSKENGGLSDARNFGVTKATGEYIAFVDAGDFMSNDWLQSLSTYMDENIDVIKYKMKKVDEQGKELEKIDGPVFDTCTGERAFENLYVSDSFLEVACIYLYRREFWTENQFSYTKDTYHEDFGLTPFVILMAKTVVSTNAYSYFYVQDGNSITRNSDYEKTCKKAYDLLLHYDILIKRLQEAHLSQKSKEQVKSYYTNCILLKTQELKAKEQKSYIKEIKKRKMISNIKVHNVKQAVKRLILQISIKLYLKLR